MHEDTYPLPHKDLLDVTGLTRRDVFRLLDTARTFHEINRRPVKKVPTLKGRTVVLFFAEPSTRTKTSFDTAGKRLSADTFALAKSGSSLLKGESLKDTALTLQAMSPDVIVLRDSSSGAAEFLAERLHCSVVNAGDGWHGPPPPARPPTPLPARTTRKPPSTETPSPTSAGSWSWNASAGRPGRKIPWSPPRTWPRRSPSGPGFPSPA